MSQNTEYTVDPSRLVSPDAAPADAAEEVSLRPKTLDDYIGQEKAKDNLSVFIQAAKKRQESLDHVLLPALRDLEKQRWPVLLRRRWASISASLPGQPLKSRGTLRRC